ncbi:MULTISPECIES: HAD family hydrolase [unclassified Lacticaseibacillus]|uniref:HAD family hydrolase n=1 Tax=unclassified Lacticaseibacillus TaxID=2759744 RepID=UPI00194332D3|nr:MULTISPECIES: HAD family hydrolase [unclassified Lacticaseibacillus]
MTPYLIVSDVDGTLAIDNTTITARTSAVINQLLDRGHQFYLATGRMHALAENMAKQIGPRAEIIASNGASYDAPGGRVHHLLGAKALAAIEAATTKHGLTGVYYTDDAVYYVSDPDPVLKQYMYSFAPKDLAMAVTQLPDVSALVAHAGEIINGNVFSLHDHGELAAVRAELAQQDLLHLSASFTNNIELIPKHVDKANAVAELQEKLAIPADHTIAFGDGQNDIGMLQSAGISVAMGNAVPAVKAAAKYETGPNTEDGLANFLADYFKL